MGNTVEFIYRDGPETADKGYDVHLPDEGVGAIFEADGDVAEIFIAPSLFKDGMTLSQSVGNQVIGMNADMSIPETDFLHIKLLSVPTDDLALQEFAFMHDSAGLILPLSNKDGSNDKKSCNRQKQGYTTHSNLFFAACHIYFVIVYPPSLMFYSCLKQVADENLPSPGLSDDRGDGMTDGTQMEIFAQHNQ